jgi:type III pantothenate kinase
MPDPVAPVLPESIWLALIVGNTRLHWALFEEMALRSVWHTPHLPAPIAERLIAANFAPDGWSVLPTWPPESSPLPTAWLERAAMSPPLPLYLASVVPQQTPLWQTYEAYQEICLEQVPLDNLYPTLGIDRALNLLGAGDRYGWPVLVIDAGTALTFTAGTAGQFLGGAILPGLALQFKALAQDTASLPAGELGTALPPRWARSTPEAIRSGVIRGCLATLADFVTDWQQQYPEAAIVLTGGDAPQLHQWVTPLGSTPWHQDDQVMFWGMARCRQTLIAKAH